MPTDGRLNSDGGMMRTSYLLFAVSAFAVGCIDASDEGEQRFAKSQSLQEQESRDALDVEVLPWPNDKSIYNHNPVMVRFINRSQDPITIFKPLDGSLWSWHMPYYRLHVTDAEGKSLKLASRCGVSGLWAETKWPDDYLVTIAPGKSFETEVGIHHVIPESGPYHLSFEYVYDPSAKEQSSFPAPATAWNGTVRSREITLNLKNPS